MLGSASSSAVWARSAASASASRRLHLAAQRRRLGLRALPCRRRAAWPGRSRGRGRCGGLARFQRRLRGAAARVLGQHRLGDAAAGRAARGRRRRRRGRRGSPGCRAWHRGSRARPSASRLSASRRHPGGGEDGDLVERDQRHGEADLADDVGRRQDRGGHEHADDGVAAALPELVHVQDADAAQQRQQHRQLEGDPEGQDHVHDEREVLVDLGFELDRHAARSGHRLEGDEEAPGEREDEVVGERRAEHEQEGRDDQEGRDGALLAAVEARRHEQPELGRPDREGEEGGAEEGDLQVGEEGLVERGVDHPPLAAALLRPGCRPAAGRGSRRSPWRRNSRAAKAMPKATIEYRSRCAQLQQVVDQRHRLVVDRVVVAVVAGHGGTAHVR